MPDGPVELKIGDVVLVRRLRAFFAVVQQVSGGRVAVAPCDPSITDRVVRPSEIVTVYRAIGQPAARSRRLTPSPRQLRLDDT